LLFSDYIYISYNNNTLGSIQNEEIELWWERELDVDVLGESVSTWLSHQSLLLPAPAGKNSSF